MPEVTIKYNNPRSLEALKDFAKYFDFVIATAKSGREKKMDINGVTIIAGNSSIDSTSLSEIFTGKNINAKQLRKEAWQRRK